MNRSMEVLDLFSGCGGFSLGFEQAGFNIFAANEIWKVAYETYKKNFPKVNAILGDINDKEIQDKIIDLCNGNIDVVIGGPPCQAYSLAGTRDPENPLGKLFTSYVDIVDAVRPKYFVMENVKGILSMRHFKDDTPKKIMEVYNTINKIRKSKKKKISINRLNGENESYLIPVIDLIKTTFKKIGYETSFKLLNAADYGVPQERQRVFFIGSRVKKDITFPAATHSKKPSKKQKEWVTLDDAIGDLAFQITNGDAVYYGTYSYIYMSRNRRRLWDQTSYTIQATARHTPLYPSSSPMKYVRKDEWVFGSGPYRRLSVKECARIQTFPDSFQFTGTIINKYKQIGNAVPPLLGRKIAQHLLKLMNNLI